MDEENQGLKEDGMILAMQELENEFRGVKKAGYALATAIILWLLFASYVFIRLDAIEFASKVIN